ncbi:MAG: A/G-specific adenine glycosylase [Bacteroidota bacterium]
MNFNDELLNWYQNNKRDLPWRNTTDAYVIWLSEIILQQTRVEQGMPYFNRFLEKYPTVTHFAAAPEDDILKLWQGLGYYSRGRNMLKTARLVQEQYGGVFPTSYDQLVRLTGIGEYTAAAISSFSSNEAKAVVDGNVYRVLARYLGIDEPINGTKGKKIFQETANDFLNKKAPGMHNQAMMELGAVICKPKNPACRICPVRIGCYAFKHNAINNLPVKLNKVKVRERYLNYFLVTDGGNVLVNRRGQTDIWANMYDLPLVETDSLATPAELFNHPEVIEYFGRELKIAEISPVKKHILTHQRLFVRLIILQSPVVKTKATWAFISFEDLKSLAIPKIIFIFLKNIFNL